MTAHSRMAWSARAGMLVLSLGLVLAGPVSTAGADDAAFDPTPVVTAPAVVPAPSEAPVPDLPNPVITPPGTPGPVVADPPGPAADVPGTPGADPAAPLQPPVEAPPVPAAEPAAPAVAVPRAVAPPVKPSPRVAAPVVVPPVPGEDPAAGPAAEPSPLPEPVTAAAPAAIAAAPAAIAAAALPPAVMNSQVQAAVAVATGSPLAVQMITVAVLLGAGVLYTRFLAGRTPRPAKAGK